VVRVPPLSEPKRLDVFLVDAALVPTRSQAKLLIDAGRARVDDRVEKAGHLVRGGESIEVDPLPARPDLPEPEDLPLRILYEDEHVAAIDKPAGMVVHPAPGAWRGTVVNALLHRGLVGAPATNALSERPGIVHRLDRETSGVLIVARTATAHRALSEAFKSRTVKKVYQAIVLGTPRRAEATLRWNIGRHPRERKRMSIRAHTGREAITRYTVTESFLGIAHLRVEPETGRTHQIRVHLAAMGHPVLGDALYGGRGGRALPARGPAKEFTRHALHASEITFPHPMTGRSLSIAAPLAPDMTALLERLRENEIAGEATSGRRC
jgi:23S rRNA pseudouridine1911/1915/1917 synthase